MNPFPVNQFKFKLFNELPCFLNYLFITYVGITDNLFRGGFGSFEFDLSIPKHFYPLI